MAESATAGTGDGQLDSQGFHGDPSRGHRFWCYPAHRRVVTPRWDTHSSSDQFCTNCTVMAQHRGMGSVVITEYICRGHAIAEVPDLDAKVAMMVEMGFVEDCARRALRSVDGSVERALDIAAKLAEYGTLRALPRERRTSGEMVEWWTTVDGESSLPEYRAALDAIAVAPRLMRSSINAETLDGLRAEAALRGLGTDAPIEVWKTRLAVVIAAAWELPDVAAAQQLRVSVPGVTTRGGLVFDGCVKFLHSDRGRAPLVLAALELLGESVAEATADEAAEAARFRLQMTLGYLKRGADECSARRRWVFDQIASAYGANVEKSAASRASFLGDVVASRSSAADSGGSAVDTTPGSVEDARVALVHGLTKFIDYRKERAVERVFTTPTIAYFAAAGMNAGIDSDVHGGNVHRALLLAALGVRTPRTPLLHDEVKGIAPFLRAGGEFCSTFLPLLWSDECFGKDISQIAAPRSIAQRAGRGNNFFIFNDAATPYELGEIAVNPLRSTSAQRAELAVYLEAWARYFSAECVVPALVDHMLASERLSRFAAVVWESGDFGEAARGGVGAAAASDGAAPRGGDGEEVGDRHRATSIQEWCWSEDEDCELTFEQRNAAVFLEAIGVLKPGADDDLGAGGEAGGPRERRGSKKRSRSVHR